MKRIFVFCIIILCIGFLQAQTLDKYPTYEQYLSFMQEKSQTYSNICHLDTIGTSYEGRLLLALVFENNTNNNEVTKPSFFYSAAIHGNEMTGAMMLMHLIDTLTANSEQFATLFNNISIYICPFANPDGTWHGGNNNPFSSIRYNANFVDLNRNFPIIQGAYSSSQDDLQQETEAFISYQLAKQFNLSCNLHTGSEIFNYPFDSFTSYSKQHADKDWFEALGTDFVNTLQKDDPYYFTSVEDDGVVDGGDWYVIIGSRQDWSTYYAHCREVTLEVSDDYYVNENKINLYWNRLRNSLFVFFDYAQKGFAGIVRDSLTLEPIDEVMVMINNHDTYCSEVYTNKYGYYFRPILNGSYDVTFSKNGYYPKTINISCGESISSYDVMLQKENTKLNEIEDLQISLYPTISKDYVIIKANKNLDYKIFNSMGLMMQAGNIAVGDNVINTKQLSSGLYIIELLEGGQRVNMKFIKE